MRKNDHTLSFLRTFFAALRKANISHCILRNAAEVLAGDAHDIDMAIDADKLHEADGIMRTTAKELGWKLHLNTGSPDDKFNIKTYNYYHEYQENKLIEVVHFDFFTTFNWRGRILLSNQRILENIQVQEWINTASPVVEAVQNLFTRLLFNGYIKKKYQATIAATFNGESAQVLRLMLQFLEPTLAESILHLAQHQQWDTITALRPDIVNNIQSKSPYHRLSYLTYILSKMARRKGLCVAFLGTDGSGKSTIIHGLPSIIGNTFSGSTLDYYHWRPGLIKPEQRLSDEGIVVSCVQPHTLPPYGTFISVLKMLFYTVDYILGYWCKVWWQTAKGHLVVFDRYYYDFYLDKIRYRLHVSDSFVRLLQYFIPKPDITFLLVGNARQIYERKKEMPLDEVQKQIDTLRRIAPQCSNAVEVNVERSIPDVLYEVSSHILHVLNQRNDTD